MEETASAASLVLREVVGVLFIAWGLSKLRDVQAFREAIRDYQILPAEWAPALARLVPLLECGVGLLLLVGLATRYASSLGAGLVTIFGVGILINLRRGRHINCGCRAGAEDPISFRHVIRNAGIAAVLVLLPLLPLHAWSIDALTYDEGIAVSLADGLVAVLMAPAIVLLWTLAISGWHLALATREELRIRDSR